METLERSNRELRRENNELRSRLRSEGGKEKKKKNMVLLRERVEMSNDEEDCVEDEIQEAETNLENIL